MFCILRRVLIHISTCSAECQSVWGFSSIPVFHPSMSFTVLRPRR